MTPPEPARLSMTTCWFQRSVIFWPIARAKISAEPPAENGTTMRIGFCGYAGDGASFADFCASAAGTVTDIAKTNAQTIFFDILPSRGEPEIIAYGRCPIITP